MNPSLNLFIVGPTGAGKTSIGRRLAAHYGLPFVDIDHEIEQQTGVPVGTIFELEGEPGFRLRETSLIDGHSLQQGVVMATGAGAVLDPLNRQRLRERGYVVWLQARVEHQLVRLERDHRRPLLAGADRHGKLLAMAAVRGPLYREVADLAIPGEHEGVALATERCIAAIDPQWKRRHAA